MWRIERGLGDGGGDRQEEKEEKVRRTTQSMSRQGEEGRRRCSGRRVCVSADGSGVCTPASRHHSDHPGGAATLIR